MIGDQPGTPTEEITVPGVVEDVGLRVLEVVDDDLVRLRDDLKLGRVDTAEAAERLTVLLDHDPSIMPPPPHLSDIVVPDAAEVAAAMPTLEYVEIDEETQT